MPDRIVTLSLKPVFKTTELIKSKNYNDVK